MSTLPPFIPRARDKVAAKMYRRLLSGERADSLSPEAQLIYVVGVLIADDRGQFTDDGIHAALSHPAVVARAEGIRAAVHACIPRGGW